jgi:hypothetical protein
MRPRVVAAPAERDEELRVMGAAVGASLDVMNIDDRVAAAGHRAASMVASDDQAADGGRDGLGGARRCRAVEPTDLLGVAAGRFHRLRLDSDWLAAAMLDRRAALFADGVGDLVRRAAVIVGPLEQTLTEESLDGVVIEALPELVHQLLSGFSKQSEGRSAQLEDEPAARDVGTWSIVGEVAWDSTRHAALDIADALSVGRVQPGPLGLGSSDPSELTDDRPEDLALSQRRGEPRQAFERLCDAEALLGHLRAMTEKALGILVKRADAETGVNADPEGEQKELAFLVIASAATSGHRQELLVELIPSDELVVLERRCGKHECASP